MNILEQAKDEEFIKEQFVKGRILDDTKDYGRTQFVDEIYTLQQENQQLKDNWNKLNEFLKSTIKENLEWDKKNDCEWQGYNAYSELLIKMQEIEQGSDSNE